MFFFFFCVIIACFDISDITFRSWNEYRRWSKGYIMSMRKLKNKTSNFNGQLAASSARQRPGSRRRQGQAQRTAALIVFFYPSCRGACGGGECYGCWYDGAMLWVMLWLGELGCGLQRSVWRVLWLERCVKDLVLILHLRPYFFYPWFCHGMLGVHRDIYSVLLWCYLLCCV